MPGSNLAGCRETDGSQSSNTFNSLINTQLLHHGAKGAAADGAMLDFMVHNGYTGTVKRLLETEFKRMAVKVVNR